MKRISSGVFLAALALAAAPPVRAAVPATGPVIQTEDVDRFYKLYDATGGHPTADQLQHDYLDPGTEGLHRLAQERNVTGVAIAKTLAAHPEIYSDAKRCLRRPSRSSPAPSTSHCARWPALYPRRRSSRQ